MPLVLFQDSIYLACIVFDCCNSANGWLFYKGELGGDDVKQLLNKSTFSEEKTKGARVYFQGDVKPCYIIKRANPDEETVLIKKYRWYHAVLDWGRAKWRNDCG